MKRSIALISSLSLLLFGVYACGSEEEANESDNETEGQEDAAEEETEGNGSVVSLINSEEEEIGTAEIKEAEEGVQMNLDASDLPEDSEHGFHIHETGTCEAPDFESAGGHFNPGDQEHGFDSEGGPHAGDLSNLTTDENGEVSEEFKAGEVTLQEGENNSLLNGDGTALVIHAEADDYESQPSGDAGDRIACGVIEE
ncbi:superoxide dismutase family protein [Salibacterium aidingense]|uniref:superoxide dismutase family protein n=1 Tax=Salibacterium aidingense TaxID=384933 RepID=UPI003BCC5A0F